MVLRSRLRAWLFFEVNFRTVVLQSRLSTAVLRSRVRARRTFKVDFSTAVFRSRLRARRSVLAVVAGAFIYNLPMFFEMKTVTHKNVCTGEMDVVSVRTPLRHSRVYYVVYKTLCFLVFRTAGPLVALIVLNTRLICALRTARQRLKAANLRLRRMTQGNRRQARRRRTTNLTLSLVVVVSVFIVCELPDLGLRSAIAVMEFMSDRRQSDVNVLRRGNTITNALLAFNSSVNFIIIPRCQLTTRTSPGIFTHVGPLFTQVSVPAGQKFVPLHQALPKCCHGHQSVELSFSTLR